MPASDVETRFRTDAIEPAHALALLEELTTRLWRASTLEEGLELILSATQQLMRADMSSVRLVDEDARVMRVAACRGFSSTFLERFGELAIPLDSDWGRAAHNRVMVVDVETDPHFRPFLELARTAGYRALQSTPVFGRNGVLLGILLTHFRAPHCPSAEELRGLELYAHQVAAFVERCRDETRLREKTARLELALAASAAATWRWSAVTNELEWDDSFHEHYGFGPADARGFDAWAARLHDEDRPCVLAWLETARVGTEPETSELEFRSVRPDGRVVWHRMIGRSDVGRDGWKGMTGIDLDVSSRRVTDDALAEAHARLAIIQQRAPFAIALKNMADGTLITANDAFVRLFELPHEGFVGKTCVELGVLDHDAHLRIDGLLQARQPVHNFEIRRRTRSGGERVLSLNWDPVTITGHEYVVATVVDLTARRRAEQTLQENNARQAYLVALSDALRPLADPAAIQEAATDLLGRTLRVDRALYGEMLSETEIVLHPGYADGVPSIAGRYPLAAFGEGVVEVAKRGGSVVVHDIATDRRLDAPGARETFAAMGVAGFMSANLVKEGRLVGALGAASAVPRFWTPFEIELLNETAERTWAALERAHADHQLRDNEARLRLVLEAARASSWSLCGTTGQARWDDRFQAQYGFAADTPGSIEAWIAGIHEADQERIRARIEEMRRGEGGDAWDVEFRAVRPDGTVVWFHSIGRAEREADGQLASVIGIQLDVTGRKRAEAELRTVSERLATIHEEAPVVFAVSRTADGRLASVNAEFTRIFGWSKEEAVGRTSLELGLWTPEERERVVARVLEGERVRNVEVRKRTKTGEERIVSMSFAPLAGHDGVHMLVVARDVTEEKRVQEVLEAHRAKEREQAEVVNTLLETAAQGIVSVDREGVIVQANAAFEKIVGWAPGELEGRSIECLDPVEEREARAARFRALWANPGVLTRELPTHIQVLRKDGSTVPVEVSVTFVPTADGGRMFTFVTDVTERLRTQHTLETNTRELEYRAHQLRRLALALTLAEQHASERLALRLHGNLQQLLASGQSTLDLLARRMAERIGDQAPLLDLVRRTLDEASSEARALARELFPRQLHRHGLAAGLKWQAAWFEEKLGLHVDLSSDPSADPRQRDVRALLFESVRELLFNAAKHAHVERVRVDLELTHDDQIRIVVADEGVGFDPAETFGPGDQRETGLGLFSISERIALIGGRLEIEAAPEAGARFTLSVPRVGHESAAGTTSSSSPRAPDLVLHAPDLTPLSVLIVDDHDLVRRGLRLLFESHPELRIVGEATNGAEAVTQARALRPDAIVMDVSMPEMDGVEATRRILQELPDTTILGLSAQESPDPISLIEQAGAAAYFTKGKDGDLLVGHLLAIREQGARVVARS